MNRKYNIQLNLSPYANYYAVGGNTGFKEVLEEENPVEFNKQIETQKDNKFLDFMNNSGGGGWAAAIAPAATNTANAIMDTESSTAERVASAMGIPALAKVWTADTAKGDANLKAMQSNIDNFAKQNHFIQDASSTFGANNAVKLNNKFIAPVPMTGVKGLSWKDFRGNMFAKGAAATLQGAAAGSVGGPWGALGGAIVGLGSSLFGGIGARSRAKKAYAEYQNKMATLTSQANSMYKQALTNQTLSNMQALANGNMSQRINDMANIRAYGGNLFAGGGDLTDEQQMVLADIQADPRILFTPKYSQWRDYIRRTSPDYLDRLYTSLPYEQQQDIYQNDREAWGALSNEAKGNFGGAQVRKKTDEVSPYVAGALGLVGAIPAWEAVTMFPMLENGLNAYFGYEGAKNLPTAVTNAYDYAKKGDWSRAGLSAGEAVLDGMFIGNGIKGVKNLSELSGLSDRIYNTFPIFDPYTTQGATFGYHGTSALDRLLGTISRRNGFTYKPEIPEFHRRLRINEPNDMRFDENGNFILSSGRTGEGHDGIVNFATSEPARGHRSHKTLSGIDDYIVNPEALKNQEFISIEPSDTFFETSELSINPKDITLVSGDTKLLDYAKSKGFNTLSSPRLREYYRKNHAKPTTSGKNSNKLSITKEGADVSPRDVGDEIQRLTSKRGAPTLEDYRFFENETGLPSGVVPIEEYNAVGQQALYGHSPSLRANLNWNNVAYDPATQVESLYRKAKINPDDTEAVKKYNDYIDNLKRINNNTEYAMGGNLYTDLSPNMMSLWNNKQQIDQQKAMNQQFSLGLGNTAFANQFAGGGQMTSADVPENMQYYANGGTHEENPYGGIQVGVDQQGTPNLAEEGEFRWNNFVFSDRINVDANLLSSFNLAPTTKHQNKKAAKGKLSYADMAKKYAKRNKELENDPITKNSMEAFMQRLANAQEYQKKAEQLEAQKQNELQDYKTALNKQNNNPMYGTMKYNGMGNAATQQGVNSGVDAGMGNPMSNADLSNVNRSGNEMMAAYGGNLFLVGGNTDNPYKTLPVDLYGRPTVQYISDLPQANIQNPIVNKTDDQYLTELTDPWARQRLLINTGYMKPEHYTGYWGNISKAAWDNFNLDRQAREKGNYNTAVNNFRQQTDWTDNNLNLGVRVGDATTDATNNGDGQSSVGYNTATNTGRQDLTGNLGTSNKVIGKTTPNTNPDAAVPSDPSEPPLYSTAGKYAQFGKGIMPMVWDWANKTNVAYDPYQRDADRLEALANEGPALRTADTIGGYRAPNLMDVERLNNSARSEGLAQMQAILDAANGNRGYVGAHSAQNNYNTQMGIGDNYVKTQEANNTNRLQTDQFNHGINVANQNAINAMYQDNQRAEQTQHQAALSGTAQAAALRQRENLHADEVNTERMKNRATNQAAAVDNALNYFTTQAMENQELNTRNNDPTNPYWIDKYGRTHYTGDSGLTQAIRDEFGNDKYGRNGTFTGERLTEWNNLTKKYKAKDLKEHPELWRHLVAQQREANKIDAEKAEQAKLEELEALRGTYQSNLARLNALKDSGAIISDPSYNLYTSWADEDYSGNQGLLRTRNQALDQYITQIGNNYDRYLYEKQLAQNQARALGGYLNAGQNNNNDYYSYTRI